MRIDTTMNLTTIVDRTERFFLALRFVHTVAQTAELATDLEQFKKMSQQELAC